MPFPEVRPIVLSAMLLLTPALKAQQPPASIPGSQAANLTSEASGVYHVGNGVTPPKVKFMPEPEFSQEARKKKIKGNCLVSLIVDSDGRPQEVTVARSMAEGQPPKLTKAAQSLDLKAIEAVRQYRFEPAMLEGKPVPVRMNVEVNFQIF